MPPEVPELRSKRLTGLPRALCGACTNSTQAQNQGRSQNLHSDQPAWMRQVFRKQGNQRAGKCQVSQSDTLKRSAPRPRRCKLWGDSRWNSISRRVEYICARWCTQVRAPWDHRFAPSPTRSFSSIHPALSDLTAAASWFTGRSPQISPSASLRVAFSRSLAAVSPILGSCVLCVKFLLSIHRCTSHPRLLARRANFFEGFTTTPFPTAASIHRSFTLSPYAQHSARSRCISSANRFTARAFAFPNIASPGIRPVHLPSICSSLVACTRIFAAHPRAASSASRARAAALASGSSVPLTMTMACPCVACHAACSTAPRKKGGTGHRGLRRALFEEGAGICPWWRLLGPGESLPFSLSLSSRICTPFRYILFDCVIALIPRGSSRTASFSQRR